MSDLPPFRRLGDVAADVVARFPFEKTVERVPNDPRMEFMLDALEGLPRARQKRLILRARSPEVGVIDDATAGVLIDALDLREA